MSDENLNDKPDTIPASAQAPCSAAFDALTPFVSEFKRRISESCVNSDARRVWNERMPDSFPITLNVTMGDCRRAVAVLPNDKDQRSGPP